MRSIKKLLAVLLVAAPVAAPEAHAAYPTLAGVWHCFSGSQDRRGNGGSILWQFELHLDARGNAMGAGVFSSGMGRQRFQFQGAWNVDRGEFALASREFPFAARLVSATQMSGRYPLATGNILNTGCTRVR